MGFRPPVTKTRMTCFFHDMELYSELDVRDVGAEVYARHPSTEVLMMAWAFGNDPVQMWVPAEGEPLPEALLDCVDGPDITMHAFNAPFEMAIWRHVLGYDWPISKFRCTMVEAYAMSFSGGLEDVGKQIGLPQDQQKSADGKRLINRFSKPAPANHKADRYTQETHPEEWDRFKAYCRQDVEAERAIHNFLAPYRPMSPQEWRVWESDQRINRRGLPLDLALTERAIHLHHEAKQAKIAHMRHLTGLKNPNSRDQLLPWLAEHGCPLDDLQAGTLDAVIERAEIPDQTREVLQAKRLVGMTAPTKWRAFRDRACDDGRLRGMFQYGGASRTRRWASRGINLQNLKRPKFADMDAAAVAIGAYGLPALDMLYGEPIELLASTVRAGIAAGPGYSLVVADYSSIESRVVGWLTNCLSITQTFAAGLDTYKALATTVFGVAYEDVTKEQRTFAKPGVLAGPYGQGAVGLVGYAANNGITLSEEQAQQIVTAFRTKCHEIPTFWRWLNRAVSSAIDFDAVSTDYRLRIYKEGDFLFIDLPSGRRLGYFQPRMEMKRAPWGDVIPNFTYMGMDQDTRQWKRIKTFGGGLTENIVQAIARDLLAETLVAVESAYPNVVLHVHDEIGLEVPEAQAPEALAWLIEMMSRPPAWAPELLLGAAGYIGKHYRKD